MTSAPSVHAYLGYSTRRNYKLPSPSLISPPSTCRAFVRCFHLKPKASWVPHSFLIGLPRTLPSYIYLFLEAHHVRPEVCLLLHATNCQRLHLAGNAAGHVYRLATRGLSSLRLDGTQSAHSIHLRHWRSRSPTTLHRRRLRHHHLSRPLICCREMATPYRPSGQEHGENRESPLRPVNLLRRFGNGRLDPSVHIRHRQPSQAP